jgi:flagellin-like protein
MTGKRRRTAQRRAVSPLLATIILIAIVVSAGLVVYGMLSGMLGTLSSVRDFEVASADVVRSSVGAQLSFTLKNIGNSRMVAVKVQVDGVDVSGRVFATNVGREFYAIMLNYFEVVAAEDNTRVRVERLDGSGAVVEAAENTIASKGGKWRYDGPDLQVYRVKSDKPIAVFTSSIGPDHASDDDFYSLSGTDLWLWVPAGAGRNGAVFITSYEDDTVVSITDFGNGDDSQTFTLNRGDFWEAPDAVEAPGEVWHVTAGKPVTVMAGYPENDEYEEVRSPSGREYYFTLIGDDPRVYVQASEDGTQVSVDNLDGTTGDWSGTLNKGQVYGAYIPYTRSANNVEWVRLRVSADKPVRVLDVDPAWWGASWQSSSDNPAGAGFSYTLYTAQGRYLSLIALTPTRVTISGDYSWTGNLPGGGSAWIDLGADLKNLRVESTGAVVVYTLGGGWTEGITVVPPLQAVEPGQFLAGSAFLPGELASSGRHTLTFEAYFEDGSKTSRTVVVSG